MMNAEIKNFTSLWIDTPLSVYKPENLTSFLLNVELHIGIKGETSADIFTLTICTPDKVIDLVCESPYFCRGFLFVEYYNYDLILKSINKLVNSTAGENWLEIANKLNRYMFWEFEEYK